MVSIRPMKLEDLISVQNTNILCLPENYQQKYYMYHLMSWPGISFVAEDILRSRIVGYVLGKLEEDDPTKETHGHITSLAVERSYRRRGIAQRLMEQTSRALIMLFNAKTLTLHVRVSNRAAYSLYAEVLKFEQVDRELGYYADGEDGLFMRRDLVHHALVHGIPPAEKKRFFAGRKLEGMLKHNAEHEKCSPGKVCEKLQKDLNKLSIEDKPKKTQLVRQGPPPTQPQAPLGVGSGFKFDFKVARKDGSTPTPEEARRGITFDFKVVKKEGGGATAAGSASGGSSGSSSPTKAPRSPADMACAARFKERKEKMRKSISSKSKKANKENGAEDGKDSGPGQGLNIVKL